MHAWDWLPSLKSQINFCLRISQLYNAVNMDYLVLNRKFKLSLIWLHGYSGLLFIHFFCQTFICRWFFHVCKVSTRNADWIKAQTQGATFSATSRATQLHRMCPPLQCCTWWRREYWRPAHTGPCNTTQGQDTLHVHTLEHSGKLRHGPPLASICSLRKWGGGLYLRALDVDT